MYEDWDHVSIPEMLEEFATIYRDGGSLPENIKCVFDGRATNEDGEEDESVESYVVSIWREENCASFFVEFIDCDTEMAITNSEYVAKMYENDVIEQSKQIGSDKVNFEKLVRKIFVDWKDS